TRFSRDWSSDVCSSDLGSRIITHVVNDATPNWGAGFGKVVQVKWPDVQGAFRDAWLKKTRMHLGEVFFGSPESDITVCQMVCQRSEERRVGKGGGVGWV